MIELPEPKGSGVNCPLCKTEMNFVSLEGGDSVMCLVEGCHLYYCNMPAAAVEQINLLIMANDISVLVDHQANDEGLWFVAKTAPEAYLQQALRRLHAAIEKQRGGV